MLEGQKKAILAPFILVIRIHLLFLNEIPDDLWVGVVLTSPKQTTIIFATSLSDTHLPLLNQVSDYLWVGVVVTGLHKSIVSIIVFLIGVHLHLLNQVFD